MRSRLARLVRHAPVLVAVVVVLARLPLLHRPAWPDEAGFMQVGAAWLDRVGGSALYGPYFVDRPPLLLTLTGLADRWGGLVPLRLLAAAGAAVAVLAIAALVRGVTASSGAAAWAALVAGAFLCSPYHWAFAADGELLAVPYVAVGMLAGARALARPGLRGAAWGLLAGVAAVCAVLVKQNFVDVAVFVLAAVVLALVWRSCTLRDAARVLASLVLGAAAALGTAAAWTLDHGTSLDRLWYALYEFRVDALEVSAPDSVAATQRVLAMLEAATVSGLLLVAVALISSWQPGTRSPVVGALVTVLGYDVFSVAAGTSYWLHYLLQPAVPVAALLGVLVARGGPLLRTVAGLTAVLTLAGWLALVLSPPQTAEEAVGAAIGRAAEPGDRLVTVPGHAGVNLAAGLGDPYPYLWSLPASTLDPDRRTLVRRLSAPDAPEWFVSWTPQPERYSTAYVGGVLRVRYDPVAKVCGRTIWRRADVRRPRPQAEYRAAASAQSRCASVTRLPYPLAGPLW